MYLLHFDEPLSHARHYIGFANGEGLEARIASHRAGSGAKIMAAVVRAGIGFEVVRTWEKDPRPGRTHLRASRDTERYLKGQRDASRLCPLCADERRERSNRLRRERRAGRPRLGVPWALTPEERHEREAAADLDAFDEIPF